MREYSFIEFKTTGFNNPVGKDQIIHISAIRSTLEPDARTEAFSTYVQLAEGRELTGFVQGLTGISPYDLRKENAMMLEDALDFFGLFVQDSIIVSQWAQFDLSFVPHLKTDFYCLRTVSKLLYPTENPNVMPTCDRLGIDVSGALTVSAMRELFKRYADYLETDLELFMNKVYCDPKRELTYIPPNATVVGVSE